MTYQDDITDILLRREINKFEVGWLMICIRRLLEETNRKEAYPILNLYCNWSAHVVLDRYSPVLCSVLVDLSHTIGKYSTDEFNVAFGVAMTEAIGSEKLMGNLTDFSQEFGYSDHLWRVSDSFKGFFGVLCQVIVDVPITFPSEGKMNPKAKGQWKAAETLVCGQSGRLKSLRLINVENRVCWSATLKLENPPREINLQDSRGLLYPSPDNRSGCVAQD